MTPLVVSEGVVLGKRAAGEANALVSILTEDLGLVRVRAQSSRREHSKLRYGLEPFTAGRFSLIKGRYEWKLVGAERLSRNILSAPTASRAAAGRIAKLLSRLVQGEEPASELYRSVAEGLGLLARSGTREEVESVECVLVLRILFSLGYLPKTPELEPFLHDDAAVSLELAAQSAASRSALIRAINDSLSTTGL